MILIDSNVDVGGISPSAPDEPSSQTDGFDARVFNQGEGLDPDAAWVRRDPENPATIQFAFKHGLIANDRRFLWRVIASGSEIDPHMFELNDHFSLEEAGSPLLTSPHYPDQGGCSHRQLLSMVVWLYTPGHRARYLRRQQLRMGFPFTEQ